MTRLTLPNTNKYNKIRRPLSKNSKADDSYYNHSGPSFPNSPKSSSNTGQIKGEKSMKMAKKYINRR